MDHEEDEGLQVKLERDRGEDMTGWLAE